MGLLNFVGNVDPSPWVYINGILNFLKGMPRNGAKEILLDVREDLAFLHMLMPESNSISLLDRSRVPPDEQLEVQGLLGGK